MEVNTNNTAPHIIGWWSKSCGSKLAQLNLYYKSNPIQANWKTPGYRNGVCTSLGPWALSFPVFLTLRRRWGRPACCGELQSQGFRVKVVSRFLVKRKMICVDNKLFSAKPQNYSCESLQGKFVCLMSTNNLWSG